MVWLTVSCLRAASREYDMFPTTKGRSAVRRRLALLLTTAFVPMFSTAACGEGPEEPTQEEQAREETPQEARIEEEAKEGLREKQQASYYGEEFAGDPTASGEPYDPYGFTAAHPYLPLGTELLVSYYGQRAPSSRSTTGVTANSTSPG